MLRGAAVAGAMSALGVGGVGATFLLTPGSAEVVEGIPNRALYAYVEAAKTAPCPMDWWDLAAVGAAETGHGTHGGAHITGDGTLSKEVWSPAAAQGPMQFMDTWDIPTWTSYVQMGYGDGDGDGVHNVNDIDDAANASAAYLCRSGYVAGDRDAIRNAWGAYNGGAGWRAYAESQSYVIICRRFADAYSGAAVPPLELAADLQAAAPPARIERTPRRLASNLWRHAMNAWAALGRSKDPEVVERWSKADRELFGVPSASSAPEP